MAERDDDETRRLIGRLQAGIDREESFRRLFLLHHGAVRGMFQRRGLRPQECDDLTQEVFLRVFKGIGSFRGESRFARWLFEIADHVFANELRRRSADKRGKEESLDGLEVAPQATVSLLGSTAPDALKEVMDEERSRRLARAIQELPVQMQSCFLLRYKNGLKYREIAERKGVSIDTVKAHLFQARQRLRLELGGEPDE